MQSGLVLNLADINGYEIVENGVTVTSGGLGRAKVGASTSKKNSDSIIDNLKIKINMNDLNLPVTYISLITTKTKISSLTYKMEIKRADNIISSLDILVKQYQNIVPVSEPTKLLATDEIRKFKALLDEGIINQEEFNAKKKELLNL